MDHMDYVSQFLFLNGKNQLQIFEALAFTILTLLRDRFNLDQQDWFVQNVGSKYLQAEF